MTGREEAERVAAVQPWFCERGDFWGTVRQLLLCAKCGTDGPKRSDEHRHFSGVFTPNLHWICDECFASLPDERAEILKGQP